MTERHGESERRTTETSVRVSIDLDGDGVSASTGIPFFDHMLNQLGRHGHLGLEVECQGDLEVDAHHTVEDVGIALGEAIRQALGSSEGIRRFGSAVLPMAEAKVEVAVDVSNRPYLVYRVELASDRIGDFDPALTEDFLQALSQNAGLDLHVDMRYGRSAHHVVEAVFKGLARALRIAVQIDPRVQGLPTVKGTL